MKKRKIVFDEKFFNLLQWSFRAFIIPFGGMALGGIKFINVCIKENLSKVLPYAIGMTLYGFVCTMLAVYGGFFIEYEKNNTNI